LIKNFYYISLILKKGGKTKKNLYDEMVLARLSKSRHFAIRACKDQK